MADEIKLKAPTVEQQVVVNISGEDKLEKFADTLDKISKGRGLQKYWKDQQTLINDTIKAYNNFNKSTSQTDATELIKTTNALKAMAGVDISTLIPDFDKFTSTLSKAEGIAGHLTDAFTEKAFRDAFSSFETLKAYGLDLENFFKHFEFNADVDKLVSELNNANDAVSNLKSKVTQLEDKLEESESGNGIRAVREECENLRWEIERIRDEAAETFSAFLTSNNINAGSYQYEEFFERIREGSLTAQEAIAEFKRDYSYLLEGGASFDTTQLQDFSRRLDDVLKRITDVSEKIDYISSNGVRVSDFGGSGSGNFEELANVVNQIENTNINGSASAIYESLSKILTAIKEIGQCDTDNLYHLYSTIRNLAQLNDLKVNKASLDNLADCLERICRIDNSSALTNLSLVNFKNFNDLHISKSSLNNLAEYLPQISNIDVGTLTALASLDFDKLNSLHIDKDSMKNLFSFVEGLRNATGLTDFTTENKNVESSADASTSSLKTEAELMESIATNAEKAAKAKKEFVEANKELAKATETSATALSKENSELGKMGNKSNILSPMKDTFQGQTPEIDKATNSVNKLVEAEKELVEVSKQAQNINLSNLGTSASGVAATVEKYQQGTARAPRNSKLLSSDAKLELGTELKRLQTEIIASIDSSTSFIKEVTDFYDSHNNLVKTQMKVLDKNNNMATYTTSYSVDKNGNANAWTSQILNDKGKGVEKRASVYKELLDTIKQYGEVTKRVANNEALQGDLELVQKLEAKITELQKQPILSNSQIAESERRLVSLYDQLETLEKKTAQKQNNQASAQATKEHAEVWEKNLKAIQEYMDANTKLNNLMAKDKGTGKHASDIARQEKEVEKLKESALEARVVLSSMVNPHEAPIDDWGKWIEAMEKFEQATKGSAESVAKLEDALRSARNAQLSSIDSTIDNGQSKYEDFSARKAQSDAYKNSLKELGETLERLRTLRAALSNTKAFTGEEQAQIETLTKSVREYVKEIGRMSADEKGSSDISRFKLLDRIAEYMKKNTRMSREFKAELESLMDTLRTGGANVQTGDILTQFEKIKDRIRQAKQEGISFFDIFKNKAVYGFAARLAQYYLSFYDWIRYTRYAINALVELDSALLDLKKTTSMTENQLEDFYYASNDVAKQMGVTTAEIIEQASAWSRLGYSSQEAATKMAQLSSQFASISPGMETDQAQEGLVSIMKANIYCLYVQKCA